MGKIYVNKVKVFVVILLFIGICFLPSSFVSSTANTQSIINDQDTLNFASEGTEYWALLVAVGVYADDPQQNRPLMLEEVDDLYDVLLQSGIWSEDHIKVIKGEDATVSNIFSGLRWLDEMEDEDDFSLVFFTSHGAPLSYDMFPLDEEDGVDEFLVSYWGFAYPGLYIIDDHLNIMLSRLESQGICLIVDSCYAGGFNDPPFWSKNHLVNFQPLKKETKAKEWIEGFGGELSGQKRVVLMASCEDELSYSGGFAPYLIDGLRGYADSNMDGIITAEETFYYSEPRTSRQNPTMYDGYEGELPLVYLDAPRENTINSNNQLGITWEKNIGSTFNTGFSPENSIIKGYVKDANTDDPIEDALIYIWGIGNEWEFFENETTTDINGFYSINVPSCRFRITVYADGYCGSESGFLEIGENELLWVNFSMYPHPPENSIVCGYITDEDTGEPIDGANINLFWEGDDDQFYMNDTVSDITGYYSINVAAGKINLEVEANGYFRRNLEEINIADYETRWVNISLQPRLPEDSVLKGYITDEETGSPIDNARVRIEWVDMNLGHSYHNETYSDSSGFYSINIASGELYLDIRKQGYDYYDPYRHDNDETNILWFNISLEKRTIEVDILKPLRAFYINNNRLMPYHKARIIGSIDIEAAVYEDWWGQGSAEKVEFYVDNELKATFSSEPYIWTWNEVKFGKHTIKVIAYDDEGISTSKEIEVNKFL